MNIQSWFILALVAAGVVLAIKIYRKKGTTCSCGGSSAGCGCGCAGCTGKSCSSDSTGSCSCSKK